MIRNILIMIASVIMTVACSNSELSRSEAQKAIQAAAKDYPVRMSVMFGSAKKGASAYQCQTSHLSNTEQQDDAFFSNLESAGFIKKIKYNYKMVRGIGGLPDIYNRGYACELTDKGKTEILLQPVPGKYYGNSSSLRVGKRVLNEVTGITFNKEKNQAKVVFTYQIEKDGAGLELPNDFANKNKYWQKTFSAKSLDGTAILVLYDDGWRVEVADFEQQNQVY